MPILDKDEKRIRNRRQQYASRVRRGIVARPQRCFRCLKLHPPDERDCPLAAEYERDGTFVAEEVIYSLPTFERYKGGVI